VRPELVSLFGVAVPSYFALLLVGFALATWLGVLWARRVGEDADVIVDLGIAMLLAGVVGGRLLHVLVDGHLADYVHLCTDPAAVDWPFGRAACEASGTGGTWDTARNVCHPAARDCLAWARFWTGGLTYYGGLLAALATASWLLRRDGFPFWRAADMAGFTVPLGLSLGRMGCLLEGCCFGAPSPLPWALRFPPGSPAATRFGAVTVHPTQIYESLGALVISGVCLFLVHPRKRYDGQVLVAFLILYAVLRALLEILRRDDRGALIGLSTSQWIGIGLVLFALGLHRSRRARRWHSTAA
jgi:phosphatidylglycerol:prolipoprotein diacylglycerol transferase